MADPFIVYSRHNGTLNIGAVARMKPDGTGQQFIFTPLSVSTPIGPLRPYSVPLQGSPDGTKVLVAIVYGEISSGAGTYYWTTSFFYVMNVDGSSPVRVGLGGMIGAVFSAGSPPPRSSFTGTDQGVAAGTWIDNDTVVLLSQGPSDGTRKGWQICAIDGSSNTFVDIGPITDGGASLDYGDYTPGVIVCHPDTSRLVYGAVNSGGVAEVVMANHDGTLSVILFSDPSGTKSWQLLGIRDGGYRYFLFDTIAIDWWVGSEDGIIMQHVRDLAMVPIAAQPAALSPDGATMVAGNNVPYSIFTCPYDGSLDTAATIYSDTISTPTFGGPWPGFWGICWVAPRGGAGGVVVPPPLRPGSVTVGTPLEGIRRGPRRIVGS